MPDYLLLGGRTAWPGSAAGIGQCGAGEKYKFAGKHADSEYPGRGWYAE
jgi:hypothetical protein